MRIILAPFAFVFGLMSSVISFFYKKNIIKSTKLSKPVVSVGNLTVGGSGKTPFVDILLTEFESKNLRCCVLTRGYGRKSDKTVIVNDQSTVDEVGDEPLWLFRNHPQAKIAVGADRV